MDGFSRILRSEYDKLDLTTLVLKSSAQHSKRNLEITAKVLQNILSSTTVEPGIEYEEHDGIIQIRRLQQTDSPTACVNATDGKEHAKVLLQPLSTETALSMTIRTPGLLNTLEWT